MADPTTPPTVKPGQVWEDCDIPGRHLRVAYFEARDGRRKLLAEHVPQAEATHARCEVVADPSPSYVGRKTSIKLERFQPSRSGYSLVQEAPE